jgi:RHS repeat-associated protein
VTTETQKLITISYNLLNLPYELNWLGQNKYVRYFYTFDGEKLRKTVENNGTVTKVDYCGPFVYETVSGVRSLKYIVTPEGRAVKSGSDWVYEYNLTDHLGNVRAVIRKGSNGLAELIQQKHYYPFGLEMSQLSLGTGTNKYLYNSKEIQDDFNLYWYDYGARFYDPGLGRWHSVDPLAEKMKDMSPYCYAFNNSLRFIDLDGLIPWPVIKNKDGFARGITSGFYRNTDNADGTLKKHGGIDISYRKVSNDVVLSKNSDVQSDVLATHSGKLTYYESNSATGNYIEIVNGDIKTRYLHLVKDGNLKNGFTKDVTEGEKIGILGDSGTDNFHLHYEIQEKINGVWEKVNPVIGDPQKIKSFTQEVELKDPQVLIGGKNSSLPNE